MRRGFFLVIFMLATGLPALQLWAEEARSANIDVILLLDKSLSMVSAEPAVKRYAAGTVIGPILVPGDRLIVETFYGKVDRLYAGTIRSEDDKAAIVRSLSTISPDGRFTDIGVALDRAAADLIELGMPEREKYVLLLSDERQEAPAGSKYVSPDFRLSHPALEYVRRVDMGGFRAITVGFGIAERLDSTAPQVMRLLAEPPERRSADFSTMPAGTDPGLAGAATNPKALAQGPADKTGGAPFPLATPLIVLASVLFLLFLAIIIRRVVQLGNKNRKDAERDDPD